MKNTTTATPSQIDTVLFPIEAKVNSIKDQIANLTRGAEKAAEGNLSYNGYPRYLADYVARTADELAALTAERDELRAEFTRRGGWTRYILCQNNGGHVHSTAVRCSTLHHDTMLVWMPDNSGQTEDELIEAVGHIACTVCFPLAPTTPAWARTEAAAAAAKGADKLAKWEKGMVTRVKKVANIEKRIAKAAAANDPYADTDWDARSLVWAKREVERWEAKRPTAAA